LVRDGMNNSKEIPQTWYKKHFKEERDRKTKPTVIM